MSEASPSTVAAPLPLITVDEAGDFVLEKNAMERLKSINLPIAVVAVAGQYRTGKSFLLNLLKQNLPGEEAPPSNAGPGNDDASRPGFQVGHSVQACTKGLWVWGEPMLINDESMAVVLVDTEGLGAVKKANASYDSRIFALALLLGSSFVYNSRGTIDGNAIDQLSLVVNLTKHIHVRASSQGEGNPTEIQEFQQYFPDFTWVVRDFTLQLKTMGANGRSLTQRDYLKRALADQKGISKEISKKNNVRRMLRTVFPEKDCVTLVRPHADEEKLKDLSSVPWEELRDEFKSGVLRLKKKLFANIKPKKMFGKVLNGPMLVEMIQSYVDAFNAGGAPTISNAWERVVTAQCREGIAGAMAHYTNAMNGHLTTEKEHSKMHGGVCVFDNDELQDLHETAYSRAKDILRKKVDSVSGGDSAKVLRGMMEELGEKARKTFGKIKSRNATTSEDYCTALISKIDKEEVLQAKAAKANAKKRFAAGLGAGSMAPPSAPSTPPSVPPPQLLADGGEKTKDFSVQAQLAEIRRIKAQKASGGGAAGPGSKSPASASQGPIGARLRQVQSAADKTVQRYQDDARGPAKWPILQKYLLKEVMTRMSHTAREAASSETVKSQTMQRELVRKTNELTEALASVKLLQKEKMDEKKRFQSDLRAAKERHELQEEAMVEKHQGELNAKTATVEEKEKMCKLLSETVEKLEKRLDDERSDEREWFAREREWNAKEKKLTERLREAESKNNLQQQLAASEAQTANNGHDQEKLKAAQQEVTVLQEHVELLSEHLQMTKEFLATKTQEVSECEYHWASAKAKLAQCESEKMDHETYVVHVLEPIIVSLRDKMQRKDLNDVRKMLDAIQEKRLMEL